ncbi:c-type cytochrome [candidate division KSB1 bacterium]
MRKDILLYIILVLFFAALHFSCFRGTPSDKTAVHLVPDMDNQDKFKSQGEAAVFENRSAMRMPVKGTVARKETEKIEGYYTGKTEKGDYLEKIPVPVTMQFLKHGQERYNIYCSACHSRIGDGKGLVVNKGFYEAATFHSDSLRNVPDGYIFHIISNGTRKMPALKHQVPVGDRWAVTGYVRVLQRSQNAEIEDIPEDIRNKIK